jgi:conjugative transfer pilus assembly protein TraH
MPSISLRLLSGVLVGVLLTELVSPWAARADLNAELNKVFQQWGAATINSPGVYESQQRGFLSAGGLSVRIYQRPMVPLIGFSQPRLEVGCNGVDLYLGAFSYVKLDQFIRMLQQLGMSVVAGFAFKLAMKVMCETCANVLDNLENAIRQLNALMNINPCRASLAQIESRVTKVAEAGRNLWTSMKKAGGELADFAEGFQRGAQKTVDELKQELKQMGEASPGNVLYNALRERGLDQETIELLMSAVGVLVYKETGVDVLLYPTLQAEDLIGNGVDPVTVTLYRCRSEDCVDIERQEQQSIKGLKQRVLETLQTVREKLIQRNTRLTPEEIREVNMIPVPVFEHLQRLSANTDVMMDQYIALNADYLAALMAYEWIRLAMEALFQLLPEIEQDLATRLSLPDQSETVKGFRLQIEQERRDLTRWISAKYQQYLGIQSMYQMASSDRPLTSQGAGLHRIVTQPATSGQ